MAVAPTLAVAGGIIDSFRATKLKAVESGTKTFTKPKTLVGKLIGGITGRTAAANYQESISTTSETMVIQSAKPEAAKQTPITGGFSFGGEAAKKTYFPFAVVAGIVAIFFFMRKKGGRRRR